VYVIFFTWVSNWHCITHISDVFRIGRWTDVNNQSDTRLKELSCKLSTVVMSSKADNTVKKYNTGFKCWTKWCKSLDDVNTLPATDLHVSLYLVSLMQNLCSVSKIEEAVYSIGWAHDLAGFNNPCHSFLVKSVVESARRQLGHPCKKKDPITPEEKRTVTMCLIGYAGFLRFSEILNIRATDIRFYDLYVSIFIEKSKTDKYRDGTHVIIAKTNNNTCPVKMLYEYISCANIDLSDNKFIFRQISYCKKSDTYKLRNARHISYTRAREVLLEKLEVLGLDKCKFGLLSLRSGGATAAANAGISDRLFKKTWSDKAKDGYVREDLLSQLSVLINLGI